MKKFRIFFDKDQEKEWLDRMSDQGQQMVSFKMGMFEFEAGEPGAYYYYVDLIDRANFDLEEYTRTLNKVGIEVLSQFGNYVYIRKPRANGPFKVSKPVFDQIAQYNRIGLMLMLMMFVELLAGLVELIGGILTHRPLPFIIGAVLVALGIYFLTIVIRIGKKVQKLEGKR